MKKLLSAVLTAALALSLAACGSSGSSSTATTAAAAAPAAEAPASLGKMTMGTGGTAGTYYAFGGVLGQYMKNKGGVDVTVVSTDGSKANIFEFGLLSFNLFPIPINVPPVPIPETKAFTSGTASRIS